MTFDRIKRIFWELNFDLKGVEYGKLFQQTPPCYIKIGDNATLILGDNVSFAQNVSVMVNQDCFVKIGNNVAIGQNTSLIPSNHDYKNIHGGTCIPGEIIIRDNVWIGANCVILRNVVIGEGSVIGAGSIVTKNMPEGMICFGNPCQPQRHIKEGV